ncbi:CopG family transcriptional regulator [Cellulomonas sp. H30R-01]|uniref:CopG family transcriptional regulator n=1 Tax=Cellulomonas sp. H30R-01 TaxID=2704467 RepID=UPI00138D2638|nr:CopG family transcriptional regulator [Cellulomonas sp. H30R-01]QHT57403.1 CopG family transcriptional regulator [Cellulomonas sp. H30R-01]
MAMTLRLDPADEDLLRAVAEREKRTMTDVVAIAVREHAARLDAADEDASLAARAARRSAAARAIRDSIAENAEALDLLSR